MKNFYYYFFLFLLAQFTLNDQLRAQGNEKEINSNPLLVGEKALKAHEQSNKFEAEIAFQAKMDSLRKFCEPDSEITAEERFLLQEKELLAQKESSNNTYEAVAQNPWQMESGIRELSDMRDARSKHFINSNGETFAYLASGIIHYQDDEGNWLDINNNLVASTAPDAVTYPYMNETGLFKNYFPANPFSEGILSVYKETEISERVNAIHFVDAQGVILSSLAIDYSNIKAEVNGNKIIYKNFFPHVALSYSLGNTSRKFNLEVLSADFINMIPFGAVSLMIEEEVEVNRNNGKIDFSKHEEGISLWINGENILDYAKPKALDSNMETEFSQMDGRIQLDKINDKQVRLYSYFDCSWMSSNERVFPLFLDPVVNYLPTITTFWTGRQTTSTGKTNGYLRIRGSTTASWSKYNISSLPGGATINSAIYYGRHYTGSGNTTAKQCRLRHMTNDPVPATAATLWNASNNGTIVSPNFIWAQGSNYQWRNVTLNASGVSTLQSSIAQGWYAMGTQWVSGGTSWAYHYGVNGNTSNITYLRVDYSTNCSGTPNAGTMDLSATSGCTPGDPLILDATNISTGTGISYQWQSSSSSTGPWNNIAGATTVPFTTVVSSSTTYYRLITTCSNGGASNNSNIESFGPIVAPTATGATVNCGDPATLTASGAPSGGDYIWYDDANGTNQVGTGASFTTPPLWANTSYYVQAVNSATSGGGGGGTYNVPYSGSNTITTCSGNLYDHAGPSTNYSNSANGFTVIMPGTPGAMVSVQGTTAGENCCDWVRIYDGVGIGGTLLWQGVAGSGTIPPQTSTSGPLTVRFTSDGSVVGLGFNLTISCVGGTPPCTSPLVQVNANINGPAAPTATGATVDCGDPATLSAFGSTGNYIWYDDANGTNQVGTGNSFTTPNLSQNTTYYVAATSGSGSGATSQLATTQAGGNGCGGGNMFDITTNTALNLTGFTVTPNSNGIQNVVIFYKSGTYVGSQTNQGAWTNAGTYSINGTAGTPILVNLNTPISLSGNSTYGIYVQYSAQYTTGANTYSNADMTINAGLGHCSPFDACCNPRTFNGIVHYASGCLSPLVPVTANVNGPAAPTATGATVDCGDPATLNVSGAPSGADYLWFDDANGTNQVGTGSTFTTPNLSASTTYYVGVVSGSFSTTNTVVYDIDLADLLNVPSAVGNTAWSCSNINQGFEWMDNLPSNANITSVTIEFKIGVECSPGMKNSSLNSAAQPTFNSNINHCSTASPGAAPLITINANPADYNVGANNVFGTSGHNSCFGFERAAALSNFFAQVTVVYEEPGQGCLSSLVPVNAMITPPAGPTLSASPAVFCEGGNSVITASGGPSGADYIWFDDSLGNNQIGTGVTFTTPSLTTTTTYYAQIIPSAPAVEYNFTNAGATGRLGPTQAQINSAYASTNLNGQVTINTQGIQEWTVPQTGTYIIEAAGAQGGVSAATLGRGAIMEGEFTLNQGDVLKILVGQQGERTLTMSSNYQAGGGGGSFVTFMNDTPLIVAGGGGANSISPGNPNQNGATTNNGQAGNAGAGGTNGGAGGAGSSVIGGSGITGSAGGGSQSFTAGGTGANGNANYMPSVGGFGGGGSPSGGWWNRAGGGGGYSGGGASGNSSGANNYGGGGGSFNDGVNQNNLAGANVGHGYVKITSAGGTSQCLSAITPIVIQVDEEPTAPTSIVASSNPNCLGVPVTLEAQGGSVGSGADYEWGTGSTPGLNIIGGATANSIVVTPSTTEDYWVRRVANTTCVNSTSAVVENVQVTLPSTNISVASSSAVAGDFIWNGQVSNDWNDANNWYEKTATGYIMASVSPNLSDNVFVVPSSVGGNCISFANTPVVSVLTLGSGTAQDVFIHQDSELALDNNTILDVTGDFYSFGQFTAGANSTVKFEGANDTKIAINDPHVNRFYNLEMNKVNSWNELELESNLHVDNVVTFTNGNIKLDQYTLDLGATGSFSGESELSHAYCDCPLGKIVRTVPIGAGSTVNAGNLGLSITPVVNMGTVSVERYHETIIDPINNMPQSIVRKFTVKDELGGPVQNNGNLDADIVFHYLDAELNGVIGALSLYHRAGGQNFWDEYGGTHDAIAKTVTYSGLPSFSDVTLAPFNSPLPVKFAGFTSNCKEDGAVLQWSTYSEQNASHWIIERSRDGAQWDIIAEVPAYGNTNSLMNYEYKDLAASNFEGYYRLLQVDFDGLSEYYGPFYLGCLDGSNEEMQVNVYPNPARKETYLEIKLPQEHQVAIHVVLMDATGRIIHAKDDIINEMGVQHWSIEQLQNGLYTFQVCTSDGDCKIAKFVVNR